jgi:hypothetical protein
VVALTHLFFFIRVTVDDDTPLPGGPSSPWLRPPKIFQAISSSLEVSGMASFSSKDRSTTGNPSEGSSCSYTGNDDPWDEPFGEEVGGGEDTVREGSGVEASLDEDEDALT